MRLAAILNAQGDGVGSSDTCGAGPARFLVVVCHLDAVEVFMAIGLSRL